MDLFSLRCFVAVARTGSFSRAARELYRTQPAVSLQVRKLEAELGRPLFDRSRRALVWFDGPNDNSTLLGRRLTREMHFTTGPKILRLPAIHSGVVGGSTTMRGLVAGRPPFTWAWTQTGVPTSDGVANLSYSSTLTRSPLAPADAGAYLLAVANPAGYSSATTRLVLDAGLVYASPPEGAGLWLSWPAGARLESSSNLTPGTWSPLADAVPPWYVPAVEDYVFFRTVAP